MIRVNGWVALAAGLVLGGVSVSASAAVVSFSPSTSTLGVGGSASIDVVISGLGDGNTPSIGAFDIDVTYDSGVLSLFELTFGTGLDLFGFGSLQLYDDSIAGTVNVVEISFDWETDLDDFQPAAFTLFTLVFEGKIAGTSPLGLNVNALANAAGESLFAEVESGRITVESISVVPVPQPPALWLMLAGLAGIGLIGKRR